MVNIKNVNNYTEPEIMRCCFYDIGLNNLLVDQYVGFAGGNIEVRPNRYKLLVYNFDTETTRIEMDNDITSIKAVTNSIDIDNYILQISKAKTEETDGNRIDYSNIKVFQMPDYIFVGNKEVEIYNIDGVQTIDEELNPAVQTWFIAIEIEGDKYLSSCSAVLTGLYSSIHLGIDNNENIDGSILFPLDDIEVTNGKRYLTGYFNTFGKIENINSRLALVIKNNSGNIQYWDYDISDYFLDNEEQRIIIDKKIKINISETENGGFQPTVDDWEEETENIEI